MTNFTRLYNVNDHKLDEKITIVIIISQSKNQKRYVICAQISSRYYVTVYETIVKIHTKEEGNFCHFIRSKQQYSLTISTLQNAFRNILRLVANLKRWKEK